MHSASPLPSPIAPGAVDWIGLAGPTASGKSAAALALAGTLGRPVEIVSVDSALVYRGMDIGTAKPSPAERAAVPHHLLDLLDPAQSYSAAQFVADAQAAIAQVHARGALPLLVGGTMLYFKALLEGLDAMPAADPALRATLDAEAAARGWPALHAELAQVDPATAARLAPNDAQRIQRALEVWRASGRPLSSFHRERPAAAQAEAADRARRTPLVSLEPASRAWLHERIAQRFDTMLAAGFVEEVRALRTRGDLHLGLPSMRCVGYRQAWEALDQDAQAPDLTLLRERGVAATRQLAKRQLTWLRSLPQRHVVACDDPPAQVQQAVQHAVQRLLQE
jgi:tRNA dimethylallyltransferase